MSGMMRTVIGGHVLAQALIGENFEGKRTMDGWVGGRVGGRWVDVCMRRHLCGGQL